jgi:hypothetical protein
VPLLLLGPPFFSDYSFLFRVHHLVNRDDRHLLAHAMAGGQYYYHYLMPIFCTKNRFSWTPMLWLIFWLHKLTVFWVKNAKLFCQFINIFRIITWVQGFVQRAAF